MRTFLVVVLTVLAHSATQLSAQLIYQPLSSLVLASGDDIANGHLKMNVYGNGLVDVAFIGTGDKSGTRYSNIQNGSIVVNNQQVAAGGATLNGITRVNDTVRIGFENGLNLGVWRRDGSSWVFNGASGAAGYNAAANERPVGSFDTRSNGLNGFIYKDNTGALVYLYETASNSWTRQVIESGLGAGFGSYSELSYNGSDEAIVAYKSNVGTDQLRAGNLADDTINPVNTAFSYRHMALSLADNGDLWLLDQRANNQTTLWSSINGGETWVNRGGVPDIGLGGAGVDYALAVHDNGSVIAALTYATGSQLQLVYSSDQGASWSTNTLGGAGSQIADLGFDANGTLYAAYYDAGKDQLLLDTFIPEPSSFVLLMLGFLCFWANRRHKS